MDVYASRAPPPRRRSAGTLTGPPSRTKGVAGASGARIWQNSAKADICGAARTAALVDPDGEALSKCLAEIQAQGKSQNRRRVMPKVLMRQMEIRTRRKAVTE